MGIIDRFRIENAVQTYDFWLELRGMRSRRRKEARRELRTNLRDAAADVGVTQALFNIGSPKELAYAMTPEATQRPRWSLGAMWASLAFVVVVFGLMYTASTFTSGVDASGVVGQQVTGFVFPWFGVDFMARIEPNRGGLAVGAGKAQWYVLGLPLLAFVLAARPWRAFTQKAS